MQQQTPAPKKSTRFKNWIVEHSPELAGAAVVVGFVGGLVALAVADIKSENRQVEEARQRIVNHNRWITDQQNAGNTIYALEDGRFLTVDNSATREIHLPF